MSGYRTEPLATTVTFYQSPQANGNPFSYTVLGRKMRIIIDGKKIGAASKGFVLMPNIGFRREVRGQIEVVGLDGLAYELLIPAPRK